MSIYLQNIFDEIRADGLVVNPYMGDDVLKPFEVMEQAGVILVKTSNPGRSFKTSVFLGRPLWMYILGLLE